MSYIYQKPNGDGSGLVNASDVMQAARKQVKPGSKYSLRRDDKVLFRERRRVRTLRALEKELRGLGVGKTLRVRGDKDVVFWVRGAEAAIHVIDTNGNKNSDLFWSWIKATYPQYGPSFGGGYVCKHIAGTYQMSQHSYGNAVDVFFNTSAQQDEVYAAVKRGAAPVPIAHAISHNHIWEPGSGEHYYSGEYHYHLHCDFSPQYSGGCGVRG